MVLYYMTTYIEYLSMLLMVFAFCFFFLGICYILSMISPSIDKAIGYECGFDPFSDARDPFNIKFYLISILFLLFDVEVIFFFPWAFSLEYFSFGGFYIMYLFFIVLMLGYIFEWENKCLDWD
jgi:NADH-quinone oxidoreductase subunit A